MESIHNQLFLALGNQLQADVLLKQYTTLKIGGAARYFYTARTAEELIKARKVALDLGIPTIFIGGGSNILVADTGFDGLVIKNNFGDIRIRGFKGRMSQGQSSGDVFVEAGSGAVFNLLVRTTIEQGFGGLEAHLGLPGTVGGALYMNAKWTHPVSYVGDCLYQALICTAKGEIKTVGKSYFRFGYDQSSLQTNSDMVVDAVFQLKREPVTELWQKAEDCIAYRKVSQPQGVLSAGCTFRNISPSAAIRCSTPGLTTSAGYLIDKAGLKGKIIGRVQISPIHANFMINLGDATACDMIKSIRIVQEQVQHKFKVELQEEIVKIGKF